MTGRHAQRGIALLTAIILVAIATIVAVSVAWQSALHMRRAVAVFSVEHSLTYAHLAEAGAAELLALNRSQNQNTVTPGQAWAKPQGPWEIDTGVVLEGSLEDQAGKFNLNSLVAPASPGGPLVENKPARLEFTTLLQSLNINPQYAGRLVDWLDTDNLPDPNGGAEDSYYLAQSPPYRPLNMTLTSITELLAMGMDLDSYNKLKPFVTALPYDTKLNVCTAPPEVLDAIAEVVTYTPDAASLAQRRTQQACDPDRSHFLTNVLPNRAQFVGSQTTMTSSYFRLRTWITIGTTRFTLYSLIEQDASGQIRPILRTFGTE